MVLMGLTNFLGLKHEVPHLTLLRSFQSLHDRHSVKYWKERLEQIAKQILT